MKAAILTVFIAACMLFATWQRAENRLLHAEIAAVLDATVTGQWNTRNAIFTRLRAIETGAQPVPQFPPRVWFNDEVQKATDEYEKADAVPAFPDLTPSGLTGSSWYVRSVAPVVRLSPYPRFYVPAGKTRYELGVRDDGTVVAREVK